MKAILYVFLFVTSFVFSQNYELNRLHRAPLNRVSSVEYDEENDMLYYGGGFFQVGPQVSYGAEFDLNSFTFNVGNMPTPNGRVFCAIPDDAGGWIIAGEFDMVGEEVRNRIARINADGSIHPMTTSIDGNGYVLSMESYNGKVVLAGEFTSVNNTPVSSLVEIDIETGELTEWYPNVLYVIEDIDIHNDTLYIGGAIMEIDGNERVSVAAFDLSTKQLTPWTAHEDLNFTTNQRCRALYVEDGVVYFQISYGGGLGIPSENTLVKSNIYDNSYETIVPLGYDGIISLAMYGDTLFVGGRAYNGDYLRTFNKHTGQEIPNAYNTAIGDQGYIYRLYVHDDKIFLSGAFYEIFNESRSGIAIIDLVNNELVDFGWDYWVSETMDFVPSGGKAYVCTMSDNYIQYEERYSIFRQHRATGVIDDWEPTMNGTVNGMTIYGEELIIGGQISSVGGEGASNIAKISISTGERIPWDMSSSKAIQGFVRKDNKLYVRVPDKTIIGGDFTNYFAVINLTNNVISDLNLDLNGVIYDMVVVDNTLYLAGAFTQVQGQNRNYLASVDLQTNQLTDWNPNPNTAIQTICANETILFVGGDFSTVSGESRERLAAFNIQTGEIDAWNHSADAIVRKIRIHNNNLAIVGSFTSIDDESRSNLAIIDLSMDELTSFHPRIVNTLINQLFFPSELIVSGYISSTNGLATYNFVRFSDFDHIVGFSSMYDDTESELFLIYPNPSTGNTTFVSQHTGKLDVFDVQGRPVYSQEVNENVTVLDFDLLTQGTYFLKFTTPSTSQTKQLIITE